MERLTVPSKDGNGYEASGSTGETIQRLAMYENAHEQLLSRQEDVEKEMEKLRGEGKQKSGRFKELLARKLINKVILELFG